MAYFRRIICSTFSCLALLGVGPGCVLGDPGQVERKRLAVEVQNGTWLLHIWGCQDNIIRQIEVVDPLSGAVIDRQSRLSLGLNTRELPDLDAIGLGPANEPASSVRVLTVGKTGRRERVGFFDIARFDRISVGDVLTMRGSVMSFDEFIQLAHSTCY